MNEVLETIEKHGYEIKIFSDTDAEDPRNRDNLGTMVCFPSRYTLGDENHNFSDPEEFQEWVESCKKEGDRFWISTGRDQFIWWTANGGLFVTIKWIGTIYIHLGKGN